MSFLNSVIEPCESIESIEIVIDELNDNKLDNELNDKLKQMRI